MTVTDGGKLYTTSAGSNIGAPPSGANASTVRNRVRVSGAGSVWNAGGGMLRNGYSDQAFTRSNWLQIDQGGMVTNVAEFAIGRVWARSADSNSLIVTNGGSLFSKGSVYVGHAQATSSYTSNSNSVSVAGGPYGNSQWDLGGAFLRIGYSNKADTQANANSVRVAMGGSITNAGAVTVGLNTAGVANSNALTVVTGGGIYATSVTIGSGNAIGNRLALEGGTLKTGSLNLGADSVLAPVIGSAGLTAMTVTGAATFTAGSWVDPEATKDAPVGTYTVLTAGSIVGGGNLALSPETDASTWKLQVTSTSVLLKKSDRATLLQIR
jgi:hypothetical protein